MLEGIKAYQNTKVNWAVSQANISKLLDDEGIEETRFTTISSDTMRRAGVEMKEDTNAIMLEFLKPVEEGNIPIKIVIPDIPNGDDKLKNQAYRIFFWYLKTKFEAVNCGLLEFEQEFMPFIALGKGKGLGNLWYMFKKTLLPKIISGEKADINLLDSPKEDN